MLRENSNLGHSQSLGTEWKAVKARALVLESKAHLQAALQHINDAIEHCGQPVDDMVQYVPVFACVGCRFVSSHCGVLTFAILQVSD